ncbi:MAG: HAD-IIB family hydrolase [Pseudohongiellaceae bacterium]
MALIVFTDLDGSLMEHETYSIEPARDALRELSDRQIPLILNSSKTATEMLAIRQALSLQVPFICENGAALQLQNEEIIEFGTRRSSWLQKVHELRRERGYRFEGFDDWTGAEVARRTGLSLQQAGYAKQRSYSEPILWRDSEAALQRFQKELRDLDLRLLQGGRFQSIQGLYDKSDAMHWMIAREAQQNPDLKPLVVALGDSPNDAAMLNTADIAVIIKSGKSHLIHCPEAKQLMHTSIAGPAGWNEAMLQILARYDLDLLQK